MKTIELKIYSFDELSKEAKENAINDIRNNHADDYDYIWQEAYKSVKEFNNRFNIKEGSRSWLDYNINHWDDNIVELKGLRLRTWLINNHWHDIMSRKFFNAFGDNRIVIHRNVKVHRYDMSKGARVSSSNFYYSSIMYHYSCPLTGVCYDMDLLDPIKKFIDWEGDNLHEITIEDLLNDCYNSLRKSIESEIEYNESDEGIIEHIEDNGFEFTEDGEKY